MDLTAAPSTSPQPVSRMWGWLRNSAAPYLGSLVLTLMISAYANYLKDRFDANGFALFGQSPGVYLPFFLFPVSALLWLIYRGSARRSGWVVVFLVGLAVSWAVHFWLIHLHDDMYIHNVWLYIPVLAMLAIKPPTRRQAWNCLLLMGWLTATILVLTRIFEMLGWVPIFDIPDKAATAWELKRYWLPLRELFGLEGRWPGPFGFNSKTGFMSVFLVILGAADRRKSSWILVAIGIVGMLLTGGRGVYLSLVSGLVVLILLASRGPISRIPMVLRAGFGGAVVVAVGLAFFFSPLSTTGRIGDNGIWNSFLDLWQTSIWTGVGQQGIWHSVGRAHDAMDAHSIYVQELAKFGLLGFVVQYAAIAIGVALVAVVAFRGWAAPLAIVTIYLVAGLTDLLHDGWESQSTYTLMVILCVLASGAWLKEHPGLTPPSSTNPEQRADGLALEPVQ